ncbi:hypothetical protein GOP47_0000012 [Adiantum capillus-veneris]|uniref:Pentatricopeptide repeat-containing protein n=1 Tax=Adiantum capillus-veneris TaxID=13818 RepID=A0A9D4ZQA7_ADICA|nr:hypothetical protein GOP47_0000012 [Adiantum capillus-veneris]
MFLRRQGVKRNEHRWFSVACALEELSSRRHLKEEDIEGSSRSPEPLDPLTNPKNRFGDPNNPLAQAYWREFGNLQLASRPESAYYASLLRCSGDGESVAHAHLAHFHIIQCGRSQNRYLGSLVVQAYLRCEAPEDARAWFDHIHDRNLYTWTFLITHYAQVGHCQQAFLLFNEMLHEGVLPDEHIFTSVISACGCELDSIQGSQHHSRVVGRVFDTCIAVGNALVNLYGKCGAFKNAKRTFDLMPRKNVITWTAIIAAYAMHEQSNLAFSMFKQMQAEGVFPNRVSILTIMEACSSVEQANFIHKLASQSGYDADAVVSTAIVSMYSKCSSPHCALSTFRSMRERTVVSWNAAIAVCMDNNLIEDAFHLINELHDTGVIPNKVTYINIVNALASQAEPLESRRIHLLIAQEGYDTAADVATALIHMYGRCGSLMDARCIFDGLRDRNLVSWNYIIRVYSCSGENFPAFQLFEQMKQEGLLANKYVFSSMISACANQATADVGKRMDVLVTGPGFQSDIVLSTALVNMYCKCGCLQLARSVFDSMMTRDLICWNTMLDGYALYGDSLVDVLEFFDFMQREGAVPDSASFVSIISSCASLVELLEGQSFHTAVVLRGFEADTALATAIVTMHAGLLDEGRRWWLSMQCDYGIEPIPDHYDCMIDLFSRVGQLDEAEDFLKKMPLKATAISWMSLLSACRSKADVSLGALAAERILDFDIKDPSPYPVLTSLYLAAERERE